MASAVEFNADLLQKGLKAVQELRASVAFVFDKLSNGISTQSSAEKEKLFVAELRECLSKVNNDIEELDKRAAAIPAATTPLSLGNLGLLMADPVIDKTLLHSQITQVYKWSAQVHDYATVACTILHSNAPKRSLGWTGAVTPSAKRPRRPFVNSLNIQAVDTMIQNMVRSFPDMSIACERPFGSPAVLVVTVGRTMKVLVMLRGFVIEWVSVKAFHEDLRLDNGKLDLWSSSKYLVFQKVTRHARSALLHFYSPHISGPVDSALKSFLVWLHSYKTLFSSSCMVCGQLLLDNSPPTWRDFRTLDANHEQCL